jgi:protocatechuate 3,4-dioxygenase beta subunit
MLAALILALAIPTLAAPAEPQVAGSAPRDAAPRDATQEAKSSGVIRGRITSLDTGKPLRRAQVQLTADGVMPSMVPSTPLTASSSNDGRYEFRDIPPGRYTLRVQRSGYLPLNYGQRRPGEQGRPLEIAEKEVADKVDFALPRMSVISGRVLDDVGEPIAGITVWVLQTRHSQGRRQLVATGANARTDIMGRYRLLSLPPGDYAVMGTTRETWPHDSDPKQVFGYAPTYFPGTSTAAQARRVKLGVAQEASGIDFNLVAGRTSNVRGNATSASGVPLGGETVTVTQEMGGLTMFMGSAVAVASTKVAGDGTWTVSNVPPGEYRLSMRAAARGNQPAQEGQLTINVAGVDLEGLSLVAGAGGTVRGEVVTDDGSLLPAGFDRMQVRPPFNPNARMMISVLHPDNGRVQSDGSFEVQGVLSDTVLSIGPLSGDWTLKAIELEGRDIADLPLPVEHGKTLSGVRVVLTSRPTTIRGALRDEKQNPAEGTVIVFADDSAKWRDGSRMVRATRLDQRGFFTFKGLPAGDYLLVALDYVQDGQWHDPEFLEGLRGRARRVAIADAESKQVDLVLRK